MSNTEFNGVRTAEMLTVRSQLFALGDDVRECTFHPRVAANVPGSVWTAREQYKAEKMEKKLGIKDFALELGVNYNSTAYAQYGIIHRRMAFSRCRKEYLDGSISGALTKLDASFGVKQILKRFTCSHKGCNKVISINDERCGCSGFYCLIHKARSAHNCDVRKKELADLDKKEKEENQKRDKPLPDETFEKNELSLIMDVYNLATQCLEAKKTKAKQRNTLERLHQS